MSIKTQFRPSLLRSTAQFNPLRPAGRLQSDGVVAKALPLLA